MVESTGPARAGGTHAPAARPASFASVPVSVGANQNVIVEDVTNTFEHPNGPACFVGDQTPQNETDIAIDPTDPDNLIGGANDYRFFVESEGRYDGSAAAYVSHNGGATWTNEFMPGISEENLRHVPGRGRPGVRLGSQWRGRLLREHRA